MKFKFNFNTKTISFRLNFLIVITVIGIFLLGAFNYILKTTNDKSINEILILNNLEKNSLIFSKHIKDFLLRKDLKYSNLFNKNYSELVDNFNKLDKTEEVELLMSKYKELKDKFGEIVSEWKKVGLTEKKGLRGELRDSIHKVENEIKKLNNNRIYKDILMLRRNEKDYFLRLDEKYLGKFNSNFKVLINDIKSSNLDSKVKNNLIKLSNDYKTKFLNVSESFKKIGYNENSGINSEVTTILKDANIKLGDFVEKEIYQNSKLIKNMIIINIIIFILTAFIIISISLFTKRNITKSLDRFINSIKNLFVGNKIVIKHSMKLGTSDELGKLSEELDYFVQKVKEVIKGVNDNVIEFVNSTEEIAAGSEDLASRTNEEVASLTETSSTIEEFATTVKENQKNSEESSDSLEELNNMVVENKQMMENVTQTMEEINESSKKIDSIVNVINDISFQTNLLALNAAVEAARAGEHGRGFAVVASEVRNLAQKTAESSKTIQDIIIKNVESTKKGKDLVGNMAEFFEQLMAVIEDLNNRLKQIKSSSMEQTTGIEQINAAIKQIEEVVNQNAALVEELSATGKNMKHSAVDLKKTVEKFEV